MAEYLSAARYALTGIVVGAGVAVASDAVFNYTMGAMGPVSGTTKPGAAYGRGLFALVAGSSILAAGVVLGDKLMEAINGGIEDPLYRAVYYNIALTSSSTAQQSALMVRGILMNALPKPGATVSPVAQSTSTSSVSPISSCTSGTCGQ